MKKIMNIEDASVNIHPEIDICISIEKLGENFKAYIYPVDPIPVVLGVDSGQCIQANARLNAAARNLAMYAFSSGSNYRSMNELITQVPNGLAVQGYLTLNNIFGEDIVRKIKSYLTLFGKTPFRLEINSDYFIVPWEWMYDVQPEIPSEATPNAFDSFWASERIIGRQPYRVKSILGNSEDYSKRKYPTRPRVGYLIDESLPHAIEEKRYLEELADAQRIYLVPPPICRVQNGAYATIPQINDYLSNSGLDIIHIACHAEPKNENYGPHLILFDGFIYDKGYLNWSPSISNLNNPIIFLNACTTKSREPYDTFDFVDEFWKRGSRNIIAIESLVSSQIARDLAKEFYELFLSKMPIGQALYTARNRILHRSVSPKDVMALFYALYAHPDTSLE